MARIPQSEIERIKREVSVERLVEASGVELKRVGKDLFGRCPFHAPDHTPSFSVTPATNLWNCLGACKEGGDVFKWVMKTKGVSFRHAYEILRTDPALAACSTAPVKHATVPTLAPPLALDADDQRLLNQSADYYRERFKQTPAALDYVVKRGLAHPELVDRFRLGFADRTLGLRLPGRTRRSGEEIRSRLQRIGLLRASGHEHFNGCLVIPILDEQGNVSGLYGRKIRDDLRPGTAYHLYLPGPHRGVWNIEALATSKEIILCEALIDGLSFWSAGYRNVTASYGVAGFTDDHLAAFKRYGTERVLIAYDRDEAGDRAAEALAARLTAQGIECWRILFPKGMDANEYARKVTPADKSFGLAIRKALWLGKGPAPAAPSAAITAEPQTRIVVPEERIIAGPVRAASSLGAEPEAAKEKTSEMPTDAPACAHAPAERLSAACSTTLPVSPVPPAPVAEAPVEMRAAEIVFRFGQGPHARRYRVRGLAKNLAYEVLKVNVVAERGVALHVDTLDLRAAKPKAAYVVQAAAALGLPEPLIDADLCELFRRLEEFQEQAIRGALAPKPAQEGPTMSADEREAALELLRAPDLPARIDQHLEACGLVGEGVNKRVAYLAATSRKLEQPLGVMIQSSSAAGKTTLMDAVLALMPEAERIKYSAVTGQSLFYLGEQDLQHKILAIVEEEGASRAAYALKLLQSEGELTIASTGKDPASGELKAQTYRVKGPVALLTTTTAADIDPELQNRCLVLAIDEDRAQTQAIHRAQRERRTLAGLLARSEREAIRTLHRNAQALLRPLAILNPYARALSFPDQATRTRRDHEKYLTLIDTIALLHQYQREVKRATRGGKLIEYVEATLEDIALANELAHEVLGRSLDELPPQTRRLLTLLDRFVAERARLQGIERAQVRFSRRALREASGIGDTQLRVHLERLVELEYLFVHRGGRGQNFVYELVYDGAGQDGKPFVPGLIDVAALRVNATTANLAGVTGEIAGEQSALAGSTRGHRGPNAAGSRDAEIAEDPTAARTCEGSSTESRKTHDLSDAAREPSYAQQALLIAARPATSS